MSIDSWKSDLEGGNGQVDPPRILCLVDCEGTSCGQTGKYSRKGVIRFKGDGVCCLRNHPSVHKIGIVRISQDLSN